MSHVRYTYPVEIAVSPDLAESLVAAFEDRAHVHNDLCQQFDTDAPYVCTCGVPRLLADLAAALLGQRETAAQPA